MDLFGLKFPSFASIDDLFMRMVSNEVPRLRSWFRMIQPHQNLMIGLQFGIGGSVRDGNVLPTNFIQWLAKRAIPYVLDLFHGLEKPLCRKNDPAPKFGLHHCLCKRIPQTIAFGYGRHAYVNRNLDWIFAILAHPVEPMKLDL
ncbi:hypothetical protein AL755_08420 [Arthrobacter sp. ERGS1:01]|nr:hypothetical protein AL755_08420 [Arthrobacter sp. ERGS1:01]